MTRILYDYDANAVGFSADRAASSWFRRLAGGGAAAKNVDEWIDGDAARCDAFAALREYGAEREGTVRFEEGCVTAAHSAVAALGAGQARALGLPERPPYAFGAGIAGDPGSPGFALVTRWYDGAKPVLARRQGAFLKTAKGDFLVPEPLFSALELAESFDARASSLPEHWAALAKFRRLLDPRADDADPAMLSAFLAGLRIYTGAALSIALSERDGEVDFDPVLFDAEAARKATEQGRPLSEADGMLDGDLLEKFQRDARTGFRAFDAAKRTYLLAPNRYLVADDDLEAALEVVREKQQAGARERRAFAANPRSAILERLAAKAGEGAAAGEAADAADPEDEDIEARAEAVFVETPEYADRADGIGVWEEPNLPFLPHAANLWRPEMFALELGGVWVRLDPKSAPELRNLVSEAIDRGAPEVEYRGERIPATPEVHDKLAEAVAENPPAPAQTEGADENDKNDGRNEPGETGGRRGNEKIVVLVHELYVEESWSPPEDPRLSKASCSTTSFKRSNGKSRRGRRAIPAC